MKYRNATTAATVAHAFSSEGEFPRRLKTRDQIFKIISFVGQEIEKEKHILIAPELVRLSALIFYLGLKFAPFLIRVNV